MNAIRWNKGKWAALVLGTAVAANACDSWRERAEPASVQAHVRSDLPGLIDGTVEALAFLDDSQAWGRANVALEGLDTVLLPLTSIGGEEVGAGGEETSPIQPIYKVARLLAPEGDAGEESPGEEVTRFLEERVFTEANYEGDGVYRLHGDLFCEEDEIDGMVDPECVDQVERAELRLLAFESDDALDVTLLVGPTRSAPLGVYLRPTSLTVAVDLAEAKEAILHVASVVGEEVELPEVLEGVVSASLTKNGEQDVTVAASVMKAVRIQGSWEGEEASFTTAAKQPLVSLRANGIARTLAASLDVGVTTLRLPWQKVAEESNATGPLDVSLAGLSASFILDETQDEFVLANLGLGEGQSTVKLDGQTLVAVDLNPGAGRHFNLSVSATETTPALLVSPKFDLSVLMHLAPLAAAGDEVESHLLDETYRVTLDGHASPALHIHPVDAETGLGGALEVVYGQLVLASTKGPTSVVVAEGKCLVGDDVTDGEHPVLGAFAATDCP